MIRLILLLALTASAGSPAAEVERLEREWSAAFLRHDTAMINRILADDFVGIDGRGVVSHKADELEEAKASASEQAFQILDEKLSGITVRVYGDTAIVNAVNDVKARFDGKEVNPVYRRTTVWIKRGGTWQCVSFHASRIIGSQ
jgi:ketosteroid isomerase-like protein